MATINDIVLSALKRAEVVDAIEAPEAHQSARAVELLNDMMFALKGRGINVMWSTQTLVDTFPLAEEHKEGVQAMLADKLANEYGKQVATRVAIDASRGYDALVADYKIIRPLRTPDGLRRMPSQRHVNEAI